MSDSKILIRQFQINDETEVVELWKVCKLTVPWNNPRKDISRKMEISPELFLVGIIDYKIITTLMGGYDGHRGWINYLAVLPEFQKHGYGRQMVNYFEYKLREMGCPKINLQIRKGNDRVYEFYKKLGYSDDRAISMGKRLEKDN
tara:strand:+ start:70 stop:504 length:435 start_codon:yes stop_codon:yes gene_type:complete